MQIKVNGKAVVLEKEVTVKELLEIQKTEMPDYVTVQLNEELVPKEAFETRLIREKDEVEFLYFMGGGRV